jgi:predicted flap endonuclease-1-like 5' DNA nuclease
MPWWMWLLLILVLLSLVVLIVLLVRWCRRRKMPEPAVEANGRPISESAASAASPLQAKAPPPPPGEEQAVAAETAAVWATAVEAAPEAAAVTRQPKIEPPDLPPDDLKIIEGIGPKISSVFQAAGITTLAQLAQTDVGELKRILTEAGIRLGDPTTWPEQAGLAAEGKWDALASLQDSLKGGRRV